MNKMRMSTKRNKKKLEILELKNTVSGWKDSLEGFNSRFMQAEERNSRLKDRRFGHVAGETSAHAGTSEHPPGAICSGRASQGRSRQREEVSARQAAGFC